MENQSPNGLGQKQENKSSFALRVFHIMDHFERWIMLLVSIVLMVIIVVAFWRLADNALQLLIQQSEGETSYIDFQTTYGMLLTLLIAVEFSRSIKAAIEGSGLVVQAKIIVLIGIIALARKFLVFDATVQDANILLAYGGVTIILGIIYWLLYKSKDNSY